MSLQSKNAKIGVYISLICFVLTPNQAFSQAIINTYLDLLKHFQDTAFSVSSSDNSIIRGIENKLYIRTHLFNEQVSIDLDKKYILAKENNYIFVQAPSIDSKEQLTLSLFNYKKDTLYFKTFKSQSLPFPSLFMGHVNLSERKSISLNDIQKADSVFIFFNNALTGNAQWLKITHITLGYSYGSYYITHENIGNKLTQKTKIMLLGLKPGQQISISTLTEGAGSIMMEVPLLYFTVQ